MNSRFLLISFILIGAWGFAFMKAAQIQILPNKRLAELQRRQYRTLIELPARRGLIQDRSGKELAVTIPAYSLFADPKEIDEPKRFARVLAKKLGVSRSHIERKIKDKNRRFVWLRRRLKKDFVDKIMKEKLRGLGVIEETERVYPNDRLLSQVLGFVGREGEGLEGLELKYDAKMKGESRKIKIERDARGRPLLVDGRVFTDAPAGFDAVLTIDHELQYRLERELSQAITEFEADSATGIIMDARTSEILAMGNLPNFDPNNPNKFSAETFRNRAVTDAFEPGSTLKSLIIAGALRDLGIKPSSKYFCENGKMKIGKRTIHEADRHHSFGMISVTDILAHSSNIGLAKIAIQLGAKRTEKILRDFGLGQSTGVDLPGESVGILQSQPWGEHLLANISFGHGLTVTPLQIVAAYGAIANGGELKSPIIVKELVNQENGDRQVNSAQVVRRVLSAEQAATMRLMLNAAASDQGTGALAQVTGYPVAGKTGTAQKNVPGKGYVQGQYISSFAGFVPANDPKYVIYVVIDNPKSKYYGSEVAAPVFSRIASYAVRVGGLAPVLITEKSILKNRPKLSDDGLRKQSIQKIREMAKVFSDQEQNLTPDLKGLSLREVYSRLRGTPIRVQVSGSGLVSHSDPAPGQELPQDKTMRLKFE